jgi:hypothetical protein
LRGVLYDYQRVKTTKMVIVRRPGTVLVIDLKKREIKANNTQTLQLRARTLKSNELQMLY